MDFERISLLLHIAEKAQGHPTLTAIRDAALAELGKHNDGTVHEEPEYAHTEETHDATDQ